MRTTTGATAPIRAEDHLRLAYMVAHRYERAGAAVGMDLDDLAQVAVVGLCKARDRFDPTLGYAWTTYAVPVIVGEVRRALRDELPSGYRRGQPGMPSTASIDALVGENEDTPLSDLLPDPNAVDAEARATEAADRELLQQAVAALPPRTRQVCDLHHFGGLSQNATARAVGVSQPTVSRLLDSAYARLRTTLSRWNSEVVPMSSDPALATAAAPCLVPGCLGTVLAKGLCRPHYESHRRYVLGGPGTKGVRIDVADWVSAGCPVRETGRVAKGQHRGERPRGPVRHLTTVPASAPPSEVDATVPAQPTPPPATLTNGAPVSLTGSAPMAATPDSIDSACREIEAEIAALQGRIADLRADLQALHGARAVLDRLQSRKGA